MTTIDAASDVTVPGAPGNVVLPATKLIGRDEHIDEVRALLREDRLITLTGVGGVGKTRLATELAVRSSSDFSDGVWFVELAPIADPSALADTVASTLAVSPHRGMTITESVSAALSVSQVLLVLDNCEHVLDAAADFAKAVLNNTTGVTVLATSREPLRIDGERCWPVPPLDLQGGVASAAVTLFAERARSARAGFALEEPDDIDAVTEICERLDGIALAIELAAARMASMSPQEMRARLGDRFRFLSGTGRTADRHRTLRAAVQWSFDLLNDDERNLLEHCFVFADGFDLAAITSLSQLDDEYFVLDLLDSLVRKSLLYVEVNTGKTRYLLLETIRQFAEDRSAAAGTLPAIRERHSRYYAGCLVERWDRWDGPDQRDVMNWVDAEFANLRSAFRCAVEKGDIETAAAIAAHSAVMIWPRQRFEPVTWAEEILTRCVEANIAHLPRLYVAASLCLYLGRPDVGLEYAQQAARLEADGSYDPFVDGWSGMMESLAHLFAGRIEQRVEVSRRLVGGNNAFSRVVGLAGLTWALPAVGREDEARAIADETLQVAREYGSPFWIGWALGGSGRAFAETDPQRALESLREGLRYADEHGLPFWTANLAQDAARLEAVHGDLHDALALFTKAVELFHRAGNVVFLAATMASMAVFLERLDRRDIATMLYGASSRQASIGLVPHLGETVERLRSALGEQRFETLRENGATMDTAEAVRYARQQMFIVGHESNTPNDRPVADGADRTTAADAPSNTHAPSNPHALSKRELEVLRHLAAGASNQELAATLFVSVATVERHISNLYRKIGVRRRSQAVQYAFEHGLA